MDQPKTYNFRKPSAIALHVAQDGPLARQYTAKDIHAFTPEQLQIFLGKHDPTADLKPTRNVAEYVDAVIAYTQPISKTPYVFAVIPGTAQLEEKIQPLLTASGHADLYPRLEGLVIENRLQLIHHERNAKQQNPAAESRTIGQSFRQLPPRYWQAALEKTNDPGAWTKKPDKPLWDDVILPLTTKGEYLRALRMALSLSVNQVAQETGKYNGDQIKSVETLIFQNSRQHHTDYQDLVGYYKNKLAAIDKPDLCKDALFENLQGSGYDASSKLFTDLVTKRPQGRPRKDAPSSQDISR